MASLITRAHQAVYGVSLPEGPSFTDTVGTTHELGRLAGAKIATGYADGTFRPEEKISRAQTTSFIARDADLFVGERLAPRPSSYWEGDWVAKMIIM
jgi:hypothetical protein